MPLSRILALLAIVLALADGLQPKDVNTFIVAAAAIAIGWDH